MANNTLTLATLDFDSIKSNLKSHLRSQDIFKDYDFDGSNMSVFIDILAYNTSLQAYYVNMLASESFLDSAQLRSSVVSHAKELNYRPRSARSAKATIRLKVTQNNSNVLTIPKGTTFTTSYNFQTFSFSTDSIRVYFTGLDESTGLYEFLTDPIDIFEGFYVTENFVINYDSETNRFIMSNDMIDVNSLVVNSLEDAGSSIVNYTLAESLLGLDKQSTKYFLQATNDNKYEVVFGDDILGRRPKDGSVIQVQYRISSGKLPNGATVFSVDSDITSDTLGRIEVATITKALGGDEPESTDSIKFNAPRHFQTQERAVTSTDYSDLLKINFPEIDAVSVYGGETISPPSYGKVFIAISITGVDGIPASKKQEYFNFIKPKMVGPLQPVFVDPTYLYCRVDTLVKYNLNVTTLKPDEIKLLVSAKISDFNDSKLDDFNTTLYESKFSKDIDDAHPSIVSSITENRVYKKINPILGSSQSIDVSYGIPLRSDIPQLADIHPSTELRTVFSSNFNFNGETAFIEDDGIGNLRIMTPIGSNFTKIRDVGTVEYASGKLKLSNFSVESYIGNSIRIYALPANRDISSGKNDIFRIELDEVNVTVEAIRQ